MYSVDENGRKVFLFGYRTYKKRINLFQFLIFKYLFIFIILMTEIKEFRKTKAIGIIKCNCGAEIRKGQHAYVPVRSLNNKLVFDNAVCEKCKNEVL